MGPGQLLLQHRGRSSQPAPSAFLFSVSFPSPSSCAYSRRPALQAISRPWIQQCHSPSDFCGSPNRRVRPQNRREQSSKYTSCLIIIVNIWEIVFSVSFWSFWRQWEDFLEFYTAHTWTLKIKLRFLCNNSFYIIGKKATVIRVEDIELFLGQKQIRAIWAGSPIHPLCEHFALF